VTESRWISAQASARASSIFAPDIGGFVFDDGKADQAGAAIFQNRALDQRRVLFEYRDRVVLAGGAFVGVQFAPGQAALVDDFVGAVGIDPFLQLSVLHAVLTQVDEFVSDVGHVQPFAGILAAAA